jgi:type II secretory pathway pseudopilin PulG
MPRPLVALGLSLILIAALVPQARAPSLLELEAVTAIQGELTATAAPNYIQALDRTQIVRTEADMRTLANAIEAYRLDQGAFPVTVPVSSPAGPAPADHRFDRVFTFANTVSGGPGNLTYPRPHMTSMPIDTFSRAAGRDLPYAYFVDRRTNHWLLWSPGPDNDYDIDPIRDFWSVSGPPRDALAQRLFDKTDPEETDGDLYLTNRR